MTGPQAADLQVPPDRDAKRLVEAILEQVTTHFTDDEPRRIIPTDLRAIHALATRLAVLLDEQDAERAEMRLVFSRTLGALQGVRDGFSDHHLPTVDTMITEADEFLARVKEGS